MQSMEQQYLLKNGLGRRAIERIAETFTRIDPEFPRKGFIADAEKGLEPLELKERIRHVIDVLSRHLPPDFSRTAAILARVPEHWVPGDPDDKLQSFAAWPVIDYIGLHGTDHPEVALDLLHDLTHLFTAEFAVRPFFKRHFDVTYRRFERWCDDPGEHIRRLASEGARPRLPWGERLPQFIADPKPVIALLERLKDDPSDYVRRSVANNLNDISKDHPDVVIGTCRRWLRKKSAERQWIVRHATRTLVKSGHPDVFPLLGYAGQPDIAVRHFSVDTPIVRFGERLTFGFEVRSTSDAEQNLVIDYGIHFMKGNGSHNRKVFKLKSVALKPGERVRIEKGHLIKPITTRRYYPGNHRVELLINGTSYANADFVLEIDGRF